VHAGAPLLLGLLLLACLAGCRKRDASEHAALRVGYFHNLTHAQALVASVEGQLGASVEWVPFGAGPAAIEALLSGSVDAAFLGTGPAINGWLKADRELVVLAAAVNGGAGLVTHGARTPEALRGKVLAAPQLGNTQDVSLRYWLLNHGLVPGKDVTVVPLSNADILGLFERGELEGAWVPEPWTSRLELEGKGTMAVDEATLWPGGRFHTTLLVATKRARRERPQELLTLLEAHVRLTGEWRAQPQVFARRVQAAFLQQTGLPVRTEVLERAFGRLEPALIPERALLQTAADHAAALHYIPQADVSGLVDRTLLDEAMREPR
jgi:NitT/TauT family transport system substrate-binding protein